MAYPEMVDVAPELVMVVTAPKGAADDFATAIVACCVNAGIGGFCKALILALNAGIVCEVCRLMIALAIAICENAGID